MAEAPQDAPETVLEPVPEAVAYEPPVVAPAKPRKRKPDLLMDEVPTVVTDVPVPKAKPKRGRPPKTERQVALVAESDMATGSTASSRKRLAVQPSGDAEQMLAISRNAIQKLRANEAAK